MTQYTKHYLNEDQVLEKQRKIKSKTSLSKPAKVKSLPKLKKKKRRVLSPQPSLKTTISEEYIFHLPKPKIIPKKQKLEKSLKKPEKLSVISSSSNNSQLIESIHSLGKKSSKAGWVRTKSNFHKSEILKQSKRPKSSHKMENSVSQKKSFYSTNRKFPISILKEKIDKGYEEMKNKNITFFPTSKYPDLKVNPFRMPKLPHPPKP